MNFGFKKTIEKKVLHDSKLRDASTKDGDNSLDFIKDVAGNKIIGTKKKEEKKELVIPMIQANHWRTKAPTFKPGDDENEDQNGVQDKAGDEKAHKEDEKGEQSLLDQAAKEILEEARKENDNWESRSENRLQDLPAVMMNKDSEGATTDDVLDVSKRAEQSTIEDYENVPIEQYGKAMLRGMGWKPGEGIGGYKKQVVAIIDPLSRPKGLGLGTVRLTEDQKEAKEGEEKLTLKRGAFVLIQGGKNRGLYGEVEGLDPDAGRVMLKLGVCTFSCHNSFNCSLLMFTCFRLEVTRCLCQRM